MDSIMFKPKLMAICGIVVISSVLIQMNIVGAATFTVGDSGGWAFNVQSWPNGKSFRAGDVLVFNYPQGVHTVVQVNQQNFASCTPTGQTHTSGSDRITLARGANFFICGIDSHCSLRGMKIQVNAA